MMKKLKKLLILVRPHEKLEKKTSGGIIIPATIRDKAEDMYGTVEAVGASSEQYIMEVKPGDEILFVQKPGHIEIDKCKLIHMDDVMMVL